MMGGLLNLGNRPLAILLNRSVARPSSPRLIVVDLISNKEICVSISFIAFFSLFAI